MAVGQGSNRPRMARIQADCVSPVSEGVVERLAERIGRMLHDCVGGEEDAKARGPRPQTEVVVVCARKDSRRRRRHDRRPHESGRSSGYRPWSCMHGFAAAGRSHSRRSGSSRPPWPPPYRGSASPSPRANRAKACSRSRRTRRRRHERLQVPRSAGAESDAPLELAGAESIQRTFGCTASIHDNRPADASTTMISISSDRAERWACTSCQQAVEPWVVLDRNEHGDHRRTPSKISPVASIFASQENSALARSAARFPSDRARSSSLRIDGHRLGKRFHVARRDEKTGLAVEHGGRDPSDATRHGRAGRTLQPPAAPFRTIPRASWTEGLRGWRSDTSRPAAAGERTVEA